VCKKTLLQQQEYNKGLEDRSERRVEKRERVVLDDIWLQTEEVIKSAIVY
jgi:hypothetical protein